MACSREAEPTKKPHAVCIPYPSQGHVSPFMQLAKLLHWRGFHITLVNTEFNHNRLIRSRGSSAVEGLPGFRFETIPDGLPPSDRDATQDVPALCESTQKNCFGPFKNLLIRLNSSSPEVPPVTCVISDGVMTFGMRAAQELGIPDVQFWTASACGFLGCLSFRQLVSRGIAPFKVDESVLEDGTLDAAINWIPGMPNIRVKDLPNYTSFRAHDPNGIMFNFMGEEAQACLKDASAIILNTFDEFEQHVVDEIRHKFPREIYTIGFLALLTKCIPENHPSLSFSGSLWKEETECLAWLDAGAPGSVVYVNYGSVTVMSDHHFIEFAWGLANSKHPFLWIVRPDIVAGGETTSSSCLPPEFHQEIQGRGKLATWCPQEKVVGHPSVGAFITHCGWNSVTEAVGLPLVCWPFFADQQTNCRFACTDDGWGVGVEVSREVKREEIEEAVREAMGSGEMRRRALEWKRKAEEAVRSGGSSFINFDRLVQTIFFHN